MSIEEGRTPVSLDRQIITLLEQYIQTAHEQKAILQEFLDVESTDMSLTHIEKLIQRFRALIPRYERYLITAHGLIDHPMNNDETTNAITQQIESIERAIEMVRIEIASLETEAVTDPRCYFQAYTPASSN